MRLSIEHETHYRFAESARHSIQYLRLTPRDDSCQNVRSWKIKTPGKLATWTDGFGNHAHVSVQDGIHDEVPVIVKGEVETYDTMGILPPDDGLPPLMFLRGTRFTNVEGPVHDFAAPFVERVSDEGAIASLHALMWQVHETMTYDSRFTDVATTAAEALEQGNGVCQDFAHLFIAGCRVMGLPARYVSGYLYDGGDARGSLASHAWAEAFIEELGWVSFDPTNNVCATDSYVRLAVGFDYDDAAPIRGVRTGGGTEEMVVHVTVRLGEAPGQ